jgi:hypothetical protein
MRFRSRPSFSTLLAAGLLALLAIGANGRVASCTGQDFAETFVEPPEVSSEDGVLDATLDIQFTNFDVGSTAVSS